MRPKAFPDLSHRSALGSGSGVLWARRWLEVAMKDEWIQVQPVRPGDGAMVDDDLGEVFGILQGLEHRPPKVTGKVDDPFEAVVETQSQPIRGHNHNRNHVGYPLDLLHGSGSIVPRLDSRPRPFPGGGELVPRSRSERQR